MAKACVAVVAIVSLALLEAFAIEHGVDGVMFSFVIIAIAGIAGYNLESIIKLIKGVGSNGTSSN